MHVQSVCCAHTPAVQSTVLHVYSDSASYPDFIRDPTGSKSGFRSEPPIAPGNHVSSCHVPRGPSTVSNLVLHTAYCAYCLTTRTVHVVTRVVSHNDPVVVQSTDDVKRIQSSVPCTCTSCHNSCFTSTKNKAEQLFFGKNKKWKKHLFLQLKNRKNFSRNIDLYIVNEGWGDARVKPQKNCV